MKNPFRVNKYEILWNLINAALAGMLVLVGSLANGGLSIDGVLAAFLAAALVIVVKFKDYWTKQEKEYCDKLNKKGQAFFSFI